MVLPGIGLNPAVFAGPTTARRLDLPCGQYYLTSINATQSIAIVAHGRTALYIGGDITASALINITLDPAAELDLLVAGTIATSSAIGIGNINYPALSRTYVGGTAPLTFTAAATLGSNFYAASAKVTWTASTDVYGAVYAGDFVGTSEVGIHYDRQVLNMGSECPPPPAPDAGVTGCGSCQDCGNQACIMGTCGACTSSAQCCAPLQCVGGMCKASR